MIGIDTNVLVRYATRDDPHQVALADRLLDRRTPDDPAFIATTVLVEVWWVLGRAYSQPAAQRIELLDTVLASPEVVVESADLVRAALARAKAGADFADAVIAITSERAGCDRTMTFDMAAAERAGMTLLN